MIRLDLHAPDGTRSPLLLGSGAREALARIWRPAWRAAAVIADDPVRRRFAPALLRLLRRRVRVVRCYGFPAGEARKTRAVKAALEDRLLADRLDRDTCIVALGGGVTTDLAGFVAATYLRGVPHVLIPTTLLAQIDAAVGGKTGVNTPAGKNLVGAFHFPAAVLVDPRFLATLPDVEWRAGLAEAVKHAVIADPTLFDRLEGRAAGLRRPRALDTDTLRRCIAVKLAVVRDDPLETGRRRVLNLGHTVAHALEAASRHRIPHGLAVAVGLAVEADLAVARCGLPAADRDRIVGLLRRLGLPTAHPMPFDRLRPFLEVDKKNRAGAVRFALPRRIGTMAGARSGWTVEVGLDDVRRAWEGRA